MRKVSFEEYNNERKTFITNVAKHNLVRSSNSKPRNSKERDIIARLDSNRWEKWKKEGNLLEISSNKVRIVL